MCRAFGLIASERSQVNRDFSCERNINQCFAHCAAISEFNIQQLQFNISYSSACSLCQEADFMLYLFWITPRALVVILQTAISRLCHCRVLAFDLRGHGKVQFITGIVLLLFHVLSYPSSSSLSLFPFIQGIQEQRIMKISQLIHLLSKYFCSLSS